MNTKEIKLESFQLKQSTVTQKNMILNALFSQVLSYGMTYIDAMVKKLLGDRVEAASEGKIDTSELAIFDNVIPFKSAISRLLNEQVPPSGISFGEMKLRLKILDLIDGMKAGEPLALPEAELKELQKIMAGIKSTVSDPMKPGEKSFTSGILDRRGALIEKVMAIEDDGTLELTEDEFKETSEAVMSMRWTVMDKNIVKFIEIFENK